MVAHHVSGGNARPKNPEPRRGGTRWRMCRPYGAYFRLVLRSHHLRGGLRCVVPNGTDGKNNGNSQFSPTGRLWLRLCRAVFMLFFHGPRNPSANRRLALESIYGTS